MARQALGPRPGLVSDGASSADALADDDAAGATGRRAGLPPLLGRRAPQHAARRQHGAGRADRPPRRVDDAHPRRLRRRDVAEPPAARGGRAVRHAGGAASGPHRPRHRAGPGTDPATAAALRRSRRPWAPRTSRATCSTSWACSVTGASSTACGRGSAPHRWRRRSPRSCCSARVATRRRSPASSGWPSPSPTTSTCRGRWKRSPLPRQLPSIGRARRALHDRHGVGCWRPTTRRAADYLAGPARLAVLAIRTGRPAALLSPDEAANHPDLAVARAMPSNRIIGTGDEVVAALARPGHAHGGGRADAVDDGVRRGGPDQDARAGQRRLVVQRMDPDVELALALADEADAITHPPFEDRRFTVDHKLDRSEVTEIDRGRGDRHRRSAAHRAKRARNHR